MRGLRRCAPRECEPHELLNKEEGHPQWGVEGKEAIRVPFHM